MHGHWARDVATFRRFKLYKNSIPRAASSGGEAYARKLKEAGVTVIATRYNGMIHDFVLLNGIQADPEPQAAIHQLSAEIKAHLAP